MLATIVTEPPGEGRLVLGLIVTVYAGVAPVTLTRKNAVVVDAEARAGEPASVILRVSLKTPAKLYMLRLWVKVWLAAVNRGFGFEHTVVVVAVPGQSLHVPV